MPYDTRPAISSFEGSPRCTRPLHRQVAETTGKMRRWGASLILVTLASCSGSDGGGGTTEPPPPTPVPTTLSLSPSSDTLRYLGETASLQVTVRDQFNKVMLQAPTPSWSTSQSNVASVTNGLVTAVGNGTTAIAATVGSASAAAQIRVEQRVGTALAAAGDQQSGVAGASLPVPLEVRLQDAGGSAVVGAPVQWAVASGGGTLSETQNLTGPGGLATARWTLGPAVGTQGATVTSGEVSTGFTAQATPVVEALVVQSIAPAVLVEGDDAIVSGSGLNGASVTVGGLQAQVLTSSANSLTFVVPLSDCRPTRELVVEVTREGQSASRSTSVRPSFTIPAMAFGEIWMSGMGGPEGHCFQFDPQADDARYLIGVQSLSESASSIAPVDLRVSSSDVVLTANSSGARASQPIPSTGPGGRQMRRLEVEPAMIPASFGPAAVGLQPTDERLLRHDEAHIEHMEEVLFLAGEMRGAACRSLRLLRALLPRSIRATK
jgi:hypothetical protein